MYVKHVCMYVYMYVYSMYVSKLENFATLRFGWGYARSVPGRIIILSGTKLLILESNFAIATRHFQCGY